jgi:hypothetical protein
MIIIVDPHFNMELFATGAESSRLCPSNYLRVRQGHFALPFISGYDPKPINRHILLR